MNYKQYMYEKWVFIIINLIIYSALALILWVYEVKLWYLVLLWICWFLPLLIFLSHDYFKKKNFFNSLIDNSMQLDKLYLLSTLIEEPEYIEGSIIYSILEKTNKIVHEEVKFYRSQQEEYREYIETWVHEIKTPIAAVKLILDNQGDYNTIFRELVKVEDYIDQVLYYARSFNASEDYLIRKIHLKIPLMNVIKKHSKSFIYKRIKLELKEIDDIIYSDIKWLEFIINQILINSINYSKQNNSKISIYTNKKENQLILTIEDNGIGIDEKDLSRVFNRGFTGQNGRTFKRSTGIGLYLCKKLADKLYIGITIQSQKNVGTKVNLTFPINKMNTLE